MNRRPKPFQGSALPAELPHLQRIEFPPLTNLGQAFRPVNLISTLSSRRWIGALTRPARQVERELRRAGSVMTPVGKVISCRCNGFHSSAEILQGFVHSFMAIDLWLPTEELLGPGDIRPANFGIVLGQ